MAQFLLWFLSLSIERDQATARQLRCLLWFQLLYDKSLNSEIKTFRSLPPDA